jgi:polar amino acid transport system substrate-binding protein
VRARIVLALLAIALATAGCESTASPGPVTVAPAEAWPAGAQQVTAAPVAGTADCNREASLRPGPLPSPGTMPPGSTMAAIAERGRLVVGVDQNTDLFGVRNPSTGQLEGFDIDVAREVARAIFGDPDRIQLRVVDASQRETALQSGLVDLVVRTYSITCDRKQIVDFSTVYFYANQKILAVRGSGIDSAAALSGKRVCAVSGTTSLSRLFELNPRPTLFSVSTWTDCLVLLQQGQVDAISTDDAVLAGLARQDHLNVDIVGASIGVEPYGVGVKKENSDLVRFVNGVLEDMRDDGTWERLYDAHLRSLGPSPGPPTASYQD